MCAAFGRRLAASFDLDGQAPCIHASSPRLTFAMLSSDRPMSGPSAPLPRDSAYLMVIVLRALDACSVWMGCQQIWGGAIATESMLMLDLENEPAIYLGSAFRTLHVWIPKADLHDASGPLSALLPGSGERLVVDPVIARLGLCLAAVLEGAQRSCQELVDHISKALLSHLIASYGSRSAPPVPRVQTGLRPWQYRKVMALIDARLSDGLTLHEMASACNLAPSTFSRAFKNSTGTTPHQWLIQERINRSVQLMREGVSSLADVAQIAGFADQSHFNRLFTRTMGVSPSAWRSSQDSAGRRGDTVALSIQNAARKTQADSMGPIVRSELA